MRFEHTCKAMAVAAAVWLGGATAGHAATVEFLQAAIGPQNAGLLSGLACRNLDHVVRLDLNVTWPDQTSAVENDGYRRLVFWNDTDEFLFPQGAFSSRQGSYAVKGYFIPRAGGVHQGIASSYFEKVDDARMPPSGMVEKKMARSGCK